MARRKFWAMLPPSRSAARTVEAATEAEAAGLEGVFSIQLGSNPWVPAAAVAAATSTLRIGTGIALALARPPFETAVAALDLDHLTEGRFTLGLGTSTRAIHDEHLGVPYDPPVARLAEAVRIIRLITTGEARRAGEFRGEFWQLDFTRLALAKPFRARLPIWVAALRTPLVRVAGELADGWSAIRRGRSAGRPTRSTARTPTALRAAGRARVGRGDQPVARRRPEPRPRRVGARRQAPRRPVRLDRPVPAVLRRPRLRRRGGAARRRRGGRRARPGRPSSPTRWPARSSSAARPARWPTSSAPLWDVADSLCLQPPPVPGEQRRAYEARSRRRSMSDTKPALRFGVAHDFRCPPGSDYTMADVYAQTMEQIALVDRLGLDLVWFSEHHFVDDGYLPNFVPVAAAAAAITSRIRIGTNIALAPFAHPLRLAEDMGILDQLSGGRMELGLGLGYAPHEFAAFGMPVLAPRLVHRGDDGDRQAGVAGRAVLAPRASAGRSTTSGDAATGAARRAAAVDGVDQPGERRPRRALRHQPAAPGDPVGGARPVARADPRPPAVTPTRTASGSSARSW